jgi:hypothetical protein
MRRLPLTTVQIGSTISEDQQRSHTRCETTV